jgi:hypothetical protein
VRNLQQSGGRTGLGDEMGLAGDGVGLTGDGTGLAAGEGTGVAGEGAGMAGEGAGDELLPSLTQMAEKRGLSLAGTAAVIEMSSRPSVTCSTPRAGSPKPAYEAASKIFLVAVKVTNLHQFSSPLPDSAQREQRTLSKELWWACAVDSAWCQV